MRYITLHFGAMKEKGLSIPEYCVLELIRSTECNSLSDITTNQIKGITGFGMATIKRAYKTLQNQKLLFLVGKKKTAAPEWKTLIKRYQNDTITQTPKGIKMIPSQNKRYQNDTQKGIKMIPKRYQNDTASNNKELTKDKEEERKTTTTDFSKKNIQDLKQSITAQNLEEKENVNPALASAETTRKIAEWLATDIGQNQMAVLQKTIAHNYTPSQIKQIIFNWANYRCKDNPNFYKKAEFDLWQNLSKWIASEYSSKYQQPRKNPKKSNRRGYSQDDMYAAAAAELAKIQGK